MFKSTSKNIDFKLFEIEIDNYINEKTDYLDSKKWIAKLLWIAESTLYKRRREKKIKISLLEKMQWLWINIKKFIL